SGSRDRVQHVLEALPRWTERRYREGSRRTAAEVVLDPAAVRARLADVRDRIARAAARAGRDLSQIHLIAVSKTYAAYAVRAVAGDGQIDFGENKLQEAQQKRQNLADLPLRWHLIGHLQSNKARKAAAEFDVIHSIDSALLLQRVD